MVINVGSQDVIIRRMAAEGEHYFESWDNEDITFEGAAHEFHNCAMDLARAGRYRRACQVLDAGIKLYPQYVDIKADFLDMGVKCQRIADCEKYYEELKEIPDRRQTWRSFRFMVSFLLWKMESCDDSKVSELRDAALEIIKRAKIRFPKDELNYLSEFEIYEASGEKEKGLEVLGEFLADPDRTVKIAPRCHLKYVDEMLDAGEYDKVIQFAFSGVAEAAQEQEGVDTGYFFYVLALATDAKLLKTDRTISDKTVADEILTYYQTAYDALDGNKRAYFDVIRKRFRIIANLSGSDRKLNDWR